MKKESKKDIYCTVKTNTSYGKHVINCLELLKDRFGLSTSQIMQDALIAYEYETRNRIPSLQTTQTGKTVQMDERQEAEEKSSHEKGGGFSDSDILGVLPSMDSSEYQI